MASILVELEKRLGVFLGKNLSMDPLKCEYLLPLVVDKLLEADRARVTASESADCRYGVTYEGDKEMVVKVIRGLKDSGLYPQKLREN